MEKEKTLKYEAPEVEVILVEVEKGFATSGENLYPVTGQG